MTDGDARDRVTEIRARLSRAMRCVSVPRPDWAGAARAMGEAMDMAARLHVDLYVAGAKEDANGD